MTLRCPISNLQTGTRCVLDDGTHTVGHAFAEPVTDSSGRVIGEVLPDGLKPEVTRAFRAVAAEGFRAVTPESIWKALKTVEVAPAKLDVVGTAQRLAPPPEAPTTWLTERRVERTCCGLVVDERIRPFACSVCNPGSYQRQLAALSGSGSPSAAVLGIDRAAGEMGRAVLVIKGPRGVVDYVTLDVAALDVVARFGGGRRGRVDPAKHEAALGELHALRAENATLLQENARLRRSLEAAERKGRNGR